MNKGYSKTYIVSHLNESSQSFIFYFQLKFPIFFANYVSVVFVKDFPGKHRVSDASFCDKNRSSLVLVCKVYQTSFL